VSSLYSAVFVKRRISGPAVLAMVTTIASVVALLSIVIMLGLMGPDELAELARLAE
jgi:hypothetical protein